MFANKNFSNLKIHSFTYKEVFIVNEHQFVLPFWANHSIKNNKKYCLITFDFHTDTRKAFNQYAISKKTGPNNDHIIWNNFRECYLKSINSGNIQEIIDITTNLANDEHIDAAFNFGYLSEAHVICINNAHNDYQILYYRPENFNELEPLGKSNTLIGNNYNKYPQNRLEDEYLENINFIIPSPPFIVDFDLDYFPTRESLLPKKRRIISEIINKAEIITIAREKNCFLENCEQQNFSVDEAEQLLLKLIEMVMSD